MVCDFDEFKCDVKGEVVVELLQYVLVKMFDMIVVCYEKVVLDWEVQVGEKVVIQYVVGKNQVYELGKEF